jgi:hypothetical protein
MSSNEERDDEDRKVTAPGAPVRAPTPEVPDTAAGLWYDPEAGNDPPPSDWKKALGFVLAVTALFAAGGAAWWWADGRYPRGSIEAVYPLDDGSVVLAIAGEPEDHLVRWDREGGRQWVAHVGQLEAWSVRGGSSLAGGVLTLRAKRDGAYETVAIDTESGAVLWKGLGRPAPEEPGPRGVTHLASEDALFELTEAVPPEVVAVDRRTGEERWRRTLPGVPQRGWVRAGWLGFDTGEAFVALDRADGHVLETIEPTGVCVAGDEVVASLADGTLRRGSPAEARVVPGLGAPLAGQCGTFQGQLIVAIENLVVDPDAPRAVREAAPPPGSAIAALQGDALAWRLDFPGLLFIGSDDQQTYPDLASFSGELSPFLPLLLADPAYGGGLAASLYAIDLPGKRIAWRTDAYASLGAMALLKAGDRQLLLGRKSLTALDAANGDLVAAVNVAGEGLMEAWHLAGGTFWLGRTSGTLGLDVGSLAPREGSYGTVDVEDGRKEIENLLMRKP